jgi:hypothetical protein
MHITYNQNHKSVSRITLNSLLYESRLQVFSPHVFIYQKCLEIFDM